MANKRRRRRQVTLDKGVTAVKPMSFFIPMAVAVDQQLDADFLKRGILHDVSFISRGPALGHNLEIDDTTLQQVFDSLKPKPRGVKSRLSHPFLEDGIVARLGRASVETLDLSGGKVRGDLRLGQYAKATPKGDLWTYVLGLAEEDADSIGLSIVFEPLPAEERTDDKGNSLTPLARIGNVLAVDVVDDPAANPDGLFGRGPSADDPDNGAGTEPDETGDSLMNPELKTYLTEKCGLKADATDEEALTFMFALPTEKRADAIRLMAPPALPAPPVEPAPEPAPPADPPADPPPVDAAAERKLERKRIADIQGLASQYGFDEEWTMGQIDASTSFEAVRLAAVEKYTAGHKPVITTGSDLNVDSLGVGIADALCLRAGVPVFDRKKTVADIRMWGRRGNKGRNPGESALATIEPHERAEQFRGMRLLEIGRAYFRAMGAPGIDAMSQTRIAELMLSTTQRMKLLGPSIAFAQSTSDFDFILADVMGKSLLAAYAEAPRTWPVWTSRETAPDFKSLKFIKLSTSPDMVIIPEGMELTFGTLRDEQETVALAKYGTALKLTMEAMVNDDMSAFGRIPMLQGNSAARLEDDTVWAILTANPNMADGNALFSVAHANLAAVAAAPSVAALDAANASFLLQTAFAPEGVDGPILNLRPETIMVPAALDGTTSQLLRSVTDPTATAAGVNNRWFGSVLQKIAEGRLDGTSATGWYMAANPSQVDTVVVVFLEGEEVPVLSEETVFGTGDKKFAVRHTVAAKAVDHRGLYYNAGA